METAYDQRLAALRQEMAAKGFDLLIVPAPENMFYLTGYDGWSFYLHQCLVISRHDPRLLWIGRSSDLAVAEACPGIGQGSCFAYPDSHLHSDSFHPYDYVAGVIRDAGFTASVVACPQDAYHFTPAAWFALERGLPASRIVSDGALLNWQRVRKSAAEIACMEEAARIGADALLAGAAEMRAGQPVNQTAGAILRAQTGAMSGRDGGYPAIMPLLIEGTGQARPHDTWSARPHSGEGPFIIEIAGVHQRYHAPMARTVFLGEPDPLHLRALEAQIACMDAIPALVRPGAVSGDIADALSRILADHGFRKSGRFGYSTGIAYPPDWGEHTLSIGTGRKDRIEEGMTLFFIPGIWGQEWSVVLGETFAVGSGGAYRIGELAYKI